MRTAKACLHNGGFLSAVSSSPSSDSGKYRLLVVRPNAHSCVTNRHCPSNVVGLWRVWPKTVLRVKALVASIPRISLLSAALASIFRRSSRKRVQRSTCCVLLRWNRPSPFRGMLATHSFWRRSSLPSSLRSVPQGFTLFGILHPANHPTVLLSSWYSSAYKKPWILRSCPALIFEDPRPFRNSDSIQMIVKLTFTFVKQGFIIFLWRCFKTQFARCSFKAWHISHISHISRLVFCVSRRYRLFS